MGGGHYTASIFVSPLCSFLCSHCSRPLLYHFNQRTRLVDKVAYGHIWSFCSMRKGRDGTSLMTIV
uniref:Uncharacterized protein n=1 Tax=Arundo donax TaxID=35708 RepID=A0A0A9DSZ9_ARUDO